MIRITQLKLPIQHTEQDLLNIAAKTLKLETKDIVNITIIKKSTDARKKHDIRFIYTIDVTLKAAYSEADIITRSKAVNITKSNDNKYSFKPSGVNKLKHRPVVVGMGPAGLFCGLLLAINGYRPLVLERGYEVNKRIKTVNHFWNTNELNTVSNVQFGEGGAGTFSDGKLNTMIKDINGRYSFVMETFIQHGAPSDILFLNKPHIGTDKLRIVVESMRKEIIRLGGEIRFEAKLTDLCIENNRLEGIEVNANEKIPCNVLIPAIGHSARDTFEMFYNSGIIMTNKPFAIGLRIEHSQDMININQYGDAYKLLPPADYKLTHQTKSLRGVYSFCMCPGGYVVNASSEEGLLAVNGMSNYLRDGQNANSAIVVTVGPNDFDSNHPLSGMEFQRKWERKAYLEGRACIPVQLFGDLLINRESVTIGHIKPSIQGQYRLSNLNNCLPAYIISSLIEGVQAFDKVIKGFANEEAILSGIETRTSSPVRIIRDEMLESNIQGIFPCGEGAGYAGGITSAAIDGIKVFEAVTNRFTPDY